MKKITAIILTIAIVIAGTSGAFAFTAMYYHPNSDHSYVALGDSFATGYGTSCDYDLLQTGIQRKLPTSYPYNLAQMLYGDEALDKYDMYAGCGYNLQDVMYLSLPDDMPLSGAEGYTVADLNSAQLGIKIYWNEKGANKLPNSDKESRTKDTLELKEAVHKAVLSADIISVDIGFGDYFDNANWYDVDCDGKVDSDSIRNLYWDSFKNDKEVQTLIRTFEAPIEALKESDNDTYKYLANYIETLVYGYCFREKFMPQLLEGLTAQNPDVTILLVGKINMLQSYVYDDGVIYLDFGAITDPVYKFFNEKDKVLAESFDNVIFVDAYGCENIATFHKNENGFNQDILNTATEAGQSYLSIEDCYDEYSLIVMTHPSDNGSVQYAARMYNAYINYLDEQKEKTEKESYPDRIKSALETMAESVATQLDEASRAFSVQMDMQLSEMKSRLEAGMSALNTQIFSQLEIAKESFEKYFHIDPVIIVK